MPRPKVLIVGGFPPPERKIFGGIVKSCQVLVSSSFSEDFDLVLVDSTQVSNPPPAFAKRLWLALFRMIEFLRALLLSRPEAAIIFTSSGASLLEKGLMVWLCRLIQVPALIFPRSGRIIDDFKASRLSRMISRFAFGGASRFLCQGMRWQDFATTELGFRLGHAPIVPNWTATPELLAIGEGRAYQPNNHHLRLLFVGWLEYNKGVMELLSAIADLKRDPYFTVSIAGLGHAEGRVREYIEQNDLQGRVNLLGWVDENRIPALMAVNDVLVLPSWAEGLPNVMIEAMAAGLAVVVSAVGNVPSVVQDGREALLVRPRDIESLRSALERILTDRRLMCMIAQNGHNLAKKKFSVEQANSKLKETLYEVISVPEAFKL